MEDFNSKYSGEQVEALLDQVASGNAGGGETLTEADIANMGFTKNQGTITEVKMNGVSKGTSGVVDLGNVITEHQDISGKVDKVSGKGLSTEDFTTALKSKLEGLSNYDDTVLSNALTTLRNDFDKLVSGDSTTAIKTFNEIIAFLDGIADTEDLASIIASIEQQIAGKQATITDLATIREGASKGATAVQPSSLSSVATSGSYNDLQDKPTIPAEQVNADWNATSGKAKILNKPTIPSAVTESTVSGWGFTKNTGTYSKPSGGIPETDLSSDVRSALVAAQSYQGTVTNITINGSTKSPSGGVVDLGSVGTYSKPSTGIPKTDLASDVQSALDNAVTREQFGDMEVIQTQGFNGSLSDTLYALPDEATGEEDDILLSKNTVKTINGQSIFGSGNITIEGGGGSSSGSEYAGNYPVVNHGTSDIGTSRVHYKLSPNTFHIWGEVTTLYLEKGNAVSGVANEYLFQFTSGMNPTTLTWRGDDRWGNKEAPVIESGYKYQISILEGVMCFTKCVTDISTIDPL